MTCIDHKPFIVRLIYQNFQQSFPDPLPAPPNKPLMDAAPFPVIRRQIAPRCSCSQHPEHRVHKPTVILGDSAPLASLTRQVWLQQCPHLVAYVMSMVSSFHFSPLHFLWLLRLYHIFRNLCRHYLGLDFCLQDSILLFVCKNCP